MPARTVQRARSVHANVRKRFNVERPFVDRLTYKERCAAALAEWQLVAS